VGLKGLKTKGKMDGTHREGKEPSSYRSGPGGEKGGQKVLGGGSGRRNLGARLREGKAGRNWKDAGCKVGGREGNQSRTKARGEIAARTAVGREKV